MWRVVNSFSLPITKDIANSREYRFQYLGVDFRCGDSVANLIKRFRISPTIGEYNELTFPMPHCTHPEMNRKERS